MGSRDEVILISDDEGSSQPRRSKHIQTGESPSNAGSVLDMTLDEDSESNANDDSDVDIMGNSSDVDIIDLDHCHHAGPSTPARDKGKSISMSPQQQALQASHAAMQRSTNPANRAERQAQLQRTVAGLTCNLPEQLHALTLTQSHAEAYAIGPVTRRVMLELLTPATVTLKERSIYEAASRAVQHQREADGSKKAKPAHEPEPVTCAAEQEVQEERSPAVRVGRGRGGRGGRGGRRGRGATSVSAGSEGQGALAGPALPARGAQQGKRKADQMEGSTAQQAKHAKHVLKRVEKGKTLCCPLCHSDTIFACDKLGGVSYAELKMIMGYRGLSPGRSQKACVDTLAASCQGLSHICPLCHGGITNKGDALPRQSQARGSMAHEQVSASSASTGLPVEEEARWADATVQQCLNLCSNVDMIYKLLIQEIQPVLAATEVVPSPIEAAGRGRGRGHGGRGGGRGGRNGGPMTLGPPLPMPPDDMWDEDSDEAIWGFSASMFHGGGSGSSTGGWAKGTGYGGPGSFYGMGSHKDEAEQRSRDAAALRQQVVDEHLQQGITNICNCLERETGQAAGKLILDCPPIWVTSVLFGGPFAASLRLLLQNGSVMEIGSKGRIYGELLRLLNVLGTSIDLVPLLYQPADFEAKPGNSPGTNKAPTSRAPSVLDALHSLNQQCHVFKKSAEQLASGSTEDIGALSLALQIIDASQELHQAVDHLKKLMPDTSASHAQQAQSVGQGRLGRPSSGTRASTEKKKGQNKQAAAAAAAQELQALQDRYVEQMRPLSFCEHDLMDAKARFHFRNQALASQSGGGEVMRKWLRRVSGEHASLSGSLPLAWTSSIFVAADPTRLDLLRVLIIGPADTPYANGCFIFDIFLPSNYPTVPPQVQFLTTGGGRIRFNPNLYDSGKVCLSLLGTWSGPSWDPTHSTILQVLISIQSMILVDDPFFNEPGYENSRATASGKAANDAYNKQQQHNTLWHAILPALKQPEPCFTQIIKLHFQLKKDGIQQQLQDWLVATDKQHTKLMKEAAMAINTELDKIQPAAPQL